MVLMHFAAMIVVVFVRVGMRMRFVGMPVFMLVPVFMRMRMSMPMFVLMTVFMRMGVGFSETVRMLVSMFVRMRMGMGVGLLLVRVVMPMSMVMLVPVIMAAIVAMFMGFILVVRMGGPFVDAKFHALHGLTLLPVEVHVEVADVELGELPLQRGGFDAEIDECADRHVAADAGETIEEEDFHERMRLDFRRDGTSRFRGD
jgi:hypothetical protein